MPWVNGCDNNAGYYKTITDMRTDVFLREGMSATTFGRNSFNDGDGSTYYIRKRKTNDVFDGYNLVELANTLVAERVKNNVTEHYINGNIALEYDNDLNMVSDGSYISNDDVSAIKNCPTRYKFWLYVNSVTMTDGSKVIKQTINDIDGQMYIRMIYIRNSEYTCRPWKRVNTTEV